jgi:hypothetical protein
MSYTTQQILSKVTDIVDSLSTAAGFTVIPTTLSAANDTVEAGLYEATTLSAVDPDLNSDNIKTGVTIFGIVGAADIQDIADADLVVAEAPTGKKFYAVSGGVKTGTGTKTLTDDNETVAAGYYAATTLSAVDAHLAAANIKSGVSIFGKAGAATVQEIGAADAGVGDVLVDKTFFSVTGAIKTGTAVAGANVDGVDGELVMTIPNGHYTGSKTATAADALLLTGNIKDGVTIFGVEGTYETPLTGDAAIGDVLDGKLFYADDGTSQLEGTMPTVALDPVSGAYPAGYHAGDVGGLVAVEAQLLSANIKSGINIFGVDGDSNVVDTTDGDAVEGDMLDGKFAYVAGVKVEGNVPAGDDVVGSNGDLEILITAGLYLGTEHTTAADTNLAVENIATGVTIFGVGGTYDTTATPITAATVADGLEGWVNGAKVTGSGTKTLSAADDHVHAGYYEETTLAAVDTDLVTSNIRAGVIIFGLSGKTEVVDTTGAAGEVKATGTVTSDESIVHAANTVLIDAKTYTYRAAIYPATVKATGTLLSSGTNVAAGKTVTIDTGAAERIYTFVETPAAEGDVDIGTDAETSLLNLKNAINADGASFDTGHHCETAHTTVIGKTATATLLTIEAVTGGVTGNDIDLETDETTYTPSAAHLEGGITISAEGDVLIGSGGTEAENAAESLDNLKLAINRTEPGTNDGVLYKCAAVHPTVAATLAGYILTLEAKTAGVAGNALDLVATSDHLTASAAHLAGGLTKAGAGQISAGYFAWVDGVKVEGSL